MITADLIDLILIAIIYLQKKSMLNLSIYIFFHNIVIKIKVTK